MSSALKNEQMLAEKSEHKPEEEDVLGDQPGEGTRDSEQRYEQTRKAIEQLFGSNARPLPPSSEHEKEITSITRLPRNSHYDPGSSSQAASSHQDPPSHQSQSQYNLDEAKNHCIILKRNKGSVKSSHRSPATDSNIKNIIQQSLSSLKKKTSKLTSPEYSPIPTMRPNQNHQDGRSSPVSQMPTNRSSAKPQEPAEGECTKKTVTINVEPIIVTATLAAGNRR